MIVNGFVSVDNIFQIDRAVWKARWPNFSPAEFMCKGSGRLMMSCEFLDNLQAIRNAVKYPLPVSSGYRSPEHNAKVSATGRKGPHTFGRAADIKVYHAEAYQLVFTAIARGMTGIGIRQAGPVGKRFIHLDDLSSADLGNRAPRPTIWEY